MRRPNFLGIGMIKCGTTWVAHVLDSHPDVFVAHEKELHYFSEYFERGEAWYHRHFRAASGERAVGEFSVSYVDGAERIAERIRRYDGSMKLLVALRDPVERAFSQYRWLLQFGHRFESFEDALEQRPDLLANGCYHRILEPYWARFPEEQFHYVLQDDIRERPDRVRRELFRFLGVDTQSGPTRADRAEGRTIVPRSRRVEQARQRVHARLKHTRLAFLITAFKRSGLSRLYRRANDARSETPAMSEGTRRRLRDHYAGDLQRLGERTGLPVERWLKGVEQGVAEY